MVPSSDQNQFSCLPSPSACNDDQRERSIAVQTLDRNQGIRSDAELNVNEDAETYETEHKNEWNVRPVPADDGCLVECEVDHDQARDTGECAGQIEFNPPLRLWA